MSDMENTQAIALMISLAFAGLVIGVCIDLYRHRKSATRDTSKKVVYVSPSRKRAMVEAGVWDDPALRTKYLKAYQDYDNPKPAPPAPLPVDVRVTLETPPAPKNKGGRPKGSKNKPKVRKRAPNKKVRRRQ
jgi:hypothetical protein